MTETPSAQAGIPGLKLFRRGKVRDVYDLEDKLLLVAGDRVSAFDSVMPELVPGKGRVLTRLSSFWFRKTATLVPNHFLSDDLNDVNAALPAGIRLSPEAYGGRVMLARKARRLDAECVVRGYLAGSGWKEYQETGAVCGELLPAGLKPFSRLPKPIFTPAAKSDTGHDRNIDRAELSRLIGPARAQELEETSLRLYSFAASFLEPKGLILADTKFEFGLIEDRVIAIDEMLTPDSSRIWSAADLKSGRAPAAYDKQMLRDYLESSGWSKTPPAPHLPPNVVEALRARYEALAKAVLS
ncbi:MAG: phosphoribosylaminoimidazolesuccinocarboxamide synthase [Elusimicrobia bacterium]|nr:phosphoribosylaminoimidazolesuccinocarboxamide synthase [Elusimicrobiota bacterium]MDE2314674.1 phosphoribosylaminoimidazolesuccinocarboxamide synthase [Elusimicrobiota bacterium]